MLLRNTSSSQQFQVHAGVDLEQPGNLDTRVGNRRSADTKALLRMAGTRRGTANVVCDWFQLGLVSTTSNDLKAVPSFGLPGTCRHIATDVRDMLACNVHKIPRALSEEVLSESLEHFGLRLSWRSRMKRSCVH